MGALDNLNSSLTNMTGSLTKVAGTISLVETAYQSLVKALDVGGVRTLERGYADLTRTLSASNAEVIKIKESVEKLSKATDYYSKTSIAEMIGKLRESTTVLGLNVKAHDQLIERFTNVYKRDAPQYLQALDRLSASMPNFNQKIRESDRSIGSLTEAFKAGPEAFSAYLKATESVSDASAKMADNIDDTFNRMSKKVKDFQTSAGEALTKSFQNSPWATGGALGALGLAGTGFSFGGTGGGGKGGVGTGGGGGRGNQALGLGGGLLFAGGYAAQAYGQENHSEGIKALGATGQVLGGGAMGFSMGGPVGAILGLLAGAGSSIYSSLSSGSEEDKAFFAKRDARNAEYHRGIDLGKYQKEAGIGAGDNIRSGQKGDPNSYKNILLESQALMADSAAIEKLLKNKNALKLMDSSDIENNMRNMIAGRENAKSNLANLGAPIGAQLGAESTRQQAAMQYNPRMVDSAKQINILEQQREVIQAKINQYSSGDMANVELKAQAEKELIDNENSIYESKQLNSEASKKMVEYEIKNLEAQKQEAELSGASVKDINDINSRLQIKARQLGMISSTQAEIAKSAGKEGDAQKYVNEQLALANQVRAKAKEIAELSMQKFEVGFGGRMSRLGVIGGALSTTQQDVEQQKRLNSPEMLALEKIQPLLKAKNDEERKTLELKTQLVDKYNAEGQIIQGQQHLLANRVSMFQAMGLGVQAAKEIGKSIRVDAEDVQRLQRQMAEIKANPNLNPEQKRGALIDQQNKISDAQLAMVNKYNIQRRTLAEQEAANVINMPNGSYINPSGISGYGMQGSGFFTGSSMYGANRPKQGTYQTQVAARFGEGIDERTPAEQFIKSLVGDLTDTLKGGLNLNITGMPDADGNVKGVLKTDAQ